MGFVFRSSGHDADHDELLADIDGGASFQNRFNHLLLRGQAAGDEEAYCSTGSEEAPVRCT